jgi:hypothetical protein
MSNDNNWFKDPQYITDEVKQLEEGEATYALRKAWNKIYGSYPTDKSLAVLWAKSALETGRWKFIHCYNFGNIKKKRATKFGADDGQFFTMYRCSEVLEGKEQWFDPPHFQTHFCGYKNVEDGAEHYIRFVSQNKRYTKAWKEVINGNPSAYSHELRVAGYYTASESLYTKGVVRLFDEFMNKKNSLLAWAPSEDEVETDPEPPMEDTDEELDTDVDNKIPTPLIPPDNKIPTPLIPPQTPTGFNEDAISTIPSPKMAEPVNKDSVSIMFVVGLVAVWTFFSQFFQSCN